MLRPYYLASLVVGVIGVSAVSIALPAGSLVKFRTIVSDGVSVPDSSSITFIGEGRMAVQASGVNAAVSRGLVVEPSGKVYLKTITVDKIIPKNGDIGVAIGALTSSTSTTGKVRIDGVKIRNTVACVGSCSQPSGYITFTSTCEIQRGGGSWETCGNQLTFHTGYEWNAYGNVSGSSCTDTNATTTNSYASGYTASPSIMLGTGSARGTYCFATYPKNGTDSGGSTNVYWEAITPADAYDKTTWTY